MKQIDFHKSEVCPHCSIHLQRASTFTCDVPWHPSNSGVGEACTILDWAACPKNDRNRRKDNES